MKVHEMNQYKHVNKYHLSYICCYIFILFSIPLIAQTQLNYGIELYNNKEYEQAIKVFENFIATQQPSSIAFMYLAQSYQALNRTTDAIRTLEHAATIFPNRYEILLLLGQLYNASYQFIAAEKTLKLCLSVRNTPEARNLLGITLYNRGVEYLKKKKYKEALTAFLSSVDYDSTLENSYINIIALYMEEKKLAEASRYVEKACALFPNTIIFKKMYADIAIEKNDFTKAETLLTELFSIRMEDIELGLKLAMIYRINGKIPEAIALYDYLLTIRPKERKIYDALIDYWKLTNNQQKIRETYERLLTAYPTDESVYHRIAQTYEHESNWKNARVIYNKILMMDSLNVTAYLAITKTYIAEKNDSSAIATLQKLLTIDETNYEALKILGELYLKCNQYSNALNIYQKMFIYYNRFSFPAMQLGKTYQSMGQLDSARYYFNLAHKTEPNNPIYIYELAVLEQSTGNKNTAANYYQQSLRLGIKKLQLLQQLVRSTIATNDGVVSINKMQQTAPLADEISTIETILSNTLNNLKTTLSSYSFINLLDSYLKEYPQSVFLLLFRAETHEQYQEYSSALTLYKKIALINPRILKVHSAMARLYEFQHNYENALLSTRKVLSLDPKNKEAYATFIRIHQKQNTLDSLCNEWLLQLKLQPDNAMLREHLIEAYHKANKLEEARKIIESNQTQ